MNDEKKIKKITVVAKWLMGIMLLLIFGIAAGWLPKTMTLMSMIGVMFVVIISLGQYKDKLKKIDEEEKTDNERRK